MGEAKVKKAGFVHLHVHTEYSVVDGLLRIPDLMGAVAAAQMPAVAITDQSNLFGMVKFYRAAQAAGVKPIIGVDIWLADRATQEQPSKLVLLCQDDIGYRNLMELVTRSYLEGQERGIPIVRADWLEGRSDGLIALSGGRWGDVGRALLAGQQEQAASLAKEWSALFPNSYYLELQRVGRGDDEVYVDRAVDLAADLGLPVVATNDVRFLRQEEFEAHEARVCIYQGRTLDDARRPRDFTDQQYLRSPEEMVELFSDVPEAVDNTVEIAKRCNVSLTLGRNVLPEFPVPEGKKVADHLGDEALAGLEQRFGELRKAGFEDIDDPEYRRRYHERLKHELDVIQQMGFPGYFLIVADFIRWAKANGIPVGPGRGSGAGSLVAYALGITNLDPLRYDLLFERFLNPERVSMPDFDIDFCMERRDQVIEYVADRYGRERVSQIITYGTMAARAVVRDVGRVLGYPYGYVDRIAKLIPFEIGMTLKRALEEGEDINQLYKDDEEVRTIIDMAQRIEGIVRNAGKHAGGVVIAPAPLTEYTPLYAEPGGQSIVTQFDKDDVEAVGLVKFDFLGLRTLTIIDNAVAAINEQGDESTDTLMDINVIPMDDVATFSLLKQCRTTAVFQLESRGMKDLVKRLQPDSFEDIIALVALFRPGPLQSGMVDDFVNRKHGYERVNYPHPALEPILRPTYGVILYQEQVMQIAQVLAGYSLGDADLLRRAMGKKKPEEMAKQREVFLAGARAQGVDEGVAAHIFDLMEKFAGYGFNKSHSAAYALLAYQTAYLKAHYPAAFMAAVLSSDMDNTDKVVTLIDEAQAMGLEVLSPDINRSDYRFKAVGEQVVQYGLGAIKGVGEAAIEGLLEERQAGGAFGDIYDLCQRIDMRKTNRRALEAMIRAGALDNLGANRAMLMAELPEALQAAEQSSRNNAAGQDDMFGLETPGERQGGMAKGAQVVVEEWDEAQRLAGEKETLGLYLTGHPIERYESELQEMISGRIGDLVAKGTDGWESEGNGRRGNSSVRVAGLVVGMRQRGGRMAFLTLDDRTGRVEVRLFDEVYHQYRRLLTKDKLLVVEGSLSADEYADGYRVTAQRVYDLAKARECFAQRLEIRVTAASADNGFSEELAEVLSPYREGHCQVAVDYQGPQARARVVFGEQWRVHPTDELIQRLKELTGPEQVRVVY